ncbi:MAG: transcriptional repressor [Halofilum sp. (in: g-proteobacteria)]|nr:transcriptional repressor [Halofilum sp. (in: g-proteobacteria)]
MIEPSRQFPLDRAQVAALLEEHHILPTQQRIDIAHLLFQRAQHLAAEQVLAQVNADYGHVSKATVYNTLGLFVRRGLVREVLIEPGRTFYDSNTRDHHHLYNIDTGELSDIPASSVRIDGGPVLPDGTQVEGMDLVIRVRHRDSG